MNIDPAHGIRAGLPVYSEDGDKLGSVKELRGVYIKIDAALQPDYWLRFEDLLSYTAERATMAFPAAQLPSRKAEVPEQP